MEKIGYLDTRFDPLYSEEVDWCYRIWKAGWKIFHLPDAKVIHLGGATMNRHPVKRYERIFEKKALFFRKHHGIVALTLYKVSLFGINLVKSIVWATLWFLRNLPAEPNKGHRVDVSAGSPRCTGDLFEHSATPRQPQPPGDHNAWIPFELGSMPFFLRVCLAYSRPPLYA